MTRKLNAWLAYAVEVGVNNVRYSISIVVVVIEAVTLNDETSVSNGLRNSEQNAVASNVIFAGLRSLLDQALSSRTFGLRFLTDFASYWLQLNIQMCYNLQVFRLSPFNDPRFSTHLDQLSSSKVMSTMYIQALLYPLYLDHHA